MWLHSCVQHALNFEAFSVVFLAKHVCRASSFTTAVISEYMRACIQIHPDLEGRRGLSVHALDFGQTQIDFAGKVGLQ